MEGIKNIVKERTRTKSKNLHSEGHYWADVISAAFGERRRFAMYLGVIKRIGIKEAQRIFSEIKQANAKSPGKLFVWKAGKIKSPSASKKTASL